MPQKKIFEDQLIVITGAAGFIGSGVIRYLNDCGLNNLLLVDDLESSDKWKNLVGKKFLDLIAPKDLFAFLEPRKKEIKAFIHLGACSDTLESNCDYLMENNYRFSVKLATYALTNNQRFIYASSAATYGDGKEGFSDNLEKLERLKPLNMYGFSKHLFDIWAKRENVLDRMVGLKYFNVFGPNENHKGHMASMIFKMTDKVLKEGVIKLYKSNTEKYLDGEQLRDFIYVKDAVKMTCNFLQDCFKNINGIFNIGTGNPVSWNTIAFSLFKALGKKAQIEYIDMPKDLAAQYQNYTCADMDKYCTAFGLGNLEATPIEDAVKDYVQHYLLKNERW